MKKLISLSMMALFLCLSGCSKEEAASHNTDTMGPYINMTQYEFFTEVNHPIDFSNIGGYDDVDGMLATRLKGYVDYTTPGDYYPYIACTDLSGNESTQIITIHVVEEGSLPSQSSIVTPEPTPSTCDNGEDENQPCSIVLPKTIARYEVVYYGQEGKELCEAAWPEEDACEVIHRNDGSFWGYGANPSKN